MRKFLFSFAFLLGFLFLLSKGANALHDCSVTDIPLGGTPRFTATGGTVGWDYAGEVSCIAGPCVGLFPTEDRWCKINPALDGSFNVSLTGVTWNLAGTYRFNLRDPAITFCGTAGPTHCTDTFIVGVAVPPTCSFTTSPSPPTGPDPFTVGFTSTSSDPDGTITDWRWDFEGTPASATGPTATSTFSCSVAPPCSRNAKLTVTDNTLRSSSCSTTINLTTAPPSCGDPNTFCCQRNVPSLTCEIINNNCNPGFKPDLTKCPVASDCPNGPGPFACIPTTAAPLCTLFATPASVNPGEMGTLTWTTTNNPTSCTASGGWSGSKNTAGGSEGFGPLFSTTTYSLRCENPSGANSCTTTVSIKGACPTACTTCILTQRPDVRDFFCQPKGPYDCSKCTGLDTAVADWCDSNTDPCACRALMQGACASECSGQTPPTCGGGPPPPLPPITTLDCVPVDLPGISCIPTDAKGFTSALFTFVAGLAILFAIIALILAGYKLIFSGGDKYAVAEAKDLATKAISGLAFILGTYLILKTIGTFLGIEAFKEMFP